MAPLNQVIDPIPWVRCASGNVYLTSCGCKLPYPGKAPSPWFGQCPKVNIFYGRPSLIQATLFWALIFWWRINKCVKYLSLQWSKWTISKIIIGQSCMVFSFFLYVKRKWSLQLKAAPGQLVELAFLILRSRPSCKSLHPWGSRRRSLHSSRPGRWWCATTLFRRPRCWWSSSPPFGSQTNC